VALVAFVPTLIAPQFSRPFVKLSVDEGEALGETASSVIRRRHAPNEDSLLRWARGESDVRRAGIHREPRGTGPVATIH